MGRVCWYEGEGNDTKETCFKVLKKSPLGEEGRMWSLVEPDEFSVPKKEHARTRWTWRKRKAFKEATHPPSSIECFVIRVQFLSFSGNNVDCDIPPSSDNRP